MHGLFFLAPHTIAEHCRDYREMMMKKSGFTMIELVMVIVVMGILAALAIPRMNRDLRQEAADNILSAIRYTQHLALMDDKHLPNNNKWQKSWWHIYFGTCNSKIFYAIGSDISLTDSSTDSRVKLIESAIDPANGRYIWANSGAQCAGTHQMSELSPNIFIGKKYSISEINRTGGCDNKYIGFDHLGRPYSSAFPTSATPNFSGYMTSECIYTFSLENGESFKISIQPETGYTQIVDQNGS
jgi:prepilin-type N-terminal cleavage/methylation domain-containing protein